MGIMNHMSNKTLGFILSLALGIITGIYAGIVTDVSIQTVPIAPKEDTPSILSFFKSNKALRGHKPIVYGYLPYWKLKDIQNITIENVTDIAYFGIYIDSAGNIKKTIRDDNNNLITEPGYNNWVNSEDLSKFIEKAQRKNKRLALTILAHDSNEFTQFLSCATCWITLRDNLIKELNRHKIRDVNLDFETTDNISKETALQYSKFVNYLNNELDSIYGDSRVTVASQADAIIKQRITDIETLASATDYIFIMAYDFKYTTSDITGPVAPIDGITKHADYDIRNMIKDYTSKAKSSKLILGVPYYGYNWNVATDDVNAPRVEGNDFIGLSQTQTYEDIQDLIERINPTILWDDISQTPYFTYTNPGTGTLRQVHYENAKSLAVKYKLAKQSDFGGIGIWALGYDGHYDELNDQLNKFIQSW